MREALREALPRQYRAAFEEKLSLYDRYELCLYFRVSSSVYKLSAVSMVDILASQHRRGVERIIYER